MTRRTHLLFIFLLFAAHAIATNSSLAGMSFKQYSLAEGLSQSTVFDIVQDELGYLWIATDDGLNQFDGQEFTVYRHTRSDNSSMLSSFTRSLLIDSKGDLWIGSENGLSRYDRRLQQFTNYPTAACEIGRAVTIYDIIEIDGGLLLATDEGVCRFDEKNGYQPLSFCHTRVMTLRNFMHYILVGSIEGLYCYYPHTDTYELLHELFQDMSVLSLEPHNKEPHKLWVGTDGAGLYCCDVVQKEVTAYRYDHQDDRSLSSDFVRSLCYDSSGTLWVGTFVGLNLMKREGEFERHYYDRGEADEISQNSVRSIFKDNQGGMWCGTYFGGLNYYHSMRNRFQHICYSSKRNSINDNVIGAMLCDEKDNVWIGTNDNGLNYYDRANDRFTAYSHKSSDKKSIPGNNVKALLFAKQGGIYVGTHGGGLSLFSPSKGTFEPIPIHDKNVYSLVYDNEGNLWIGTLNGLCIYNEQSKTLVEAGWLSVLLRGCQIHALYKDSKGHIWVGTDRGIYRNDGVGYDFVEVDVSRNRYHKVHCFEEDENGNVWIGTREGLYYYDYESDNLVEMQQAYGLPQMVIYGILTDNFNQLWISRNSGLTCYNKVTNQWRTYTWKDGLQSNQFNKYAYCVDGRGKMYFGGINGISAFYPEQMKDNPFSPQPIIHELSMMNSPVLPGDDTGILDEAIEFTKKIKIPASQSAFTVEITVPNYLSGGKNMYAYKLDGSIGSDWIYTTDSHLIFSYLPSGKYTLMVRAANNDGKWSDGVTTLDIEVLPQWWRTGWAIFLFFVLLMAIMVLCINIYTSRKLMERRLELEREEKEKDHERNQAKIRFFINLAHEFRTPLTLIMSPLQEVIGQGVHNRWMHSQLDYMMRNCKRLLSLIDQTLDYRRSELGVLGLHVSKQPLNLFVKELFELFVKEAEMRGINYNLIGVPDDEIEVLYDANYLDRILTNLIGNAFKYTSKGDSIELVVVVRDEELQLEVHDTGCGISPDHIGHIFDRFYQVEENTKGTGIGLSFVQSLVNNYKGSIRVTSRLGEGSVFKVVVPTNAAAFELAEIESDNKQYKNIIERMRGNAPTSDKPSTPDSDSDEQVMRVTDGEMKRIMLVEDDEEVRSYLLQAFSLEYDVEAYENGQLAWGRLQEQSNFDLILSDVMMPVMDGIKLCKKIKQNIQFCHIPIILLTAKSDLEDQLNAFSIGADDYIAKPFALSIVRSKVHNLFKSHQRILQRNATHMQEGNVAELVNNPLDEEFLKKAMAIIEENMDNPDFSTDDFSKAMYMSRSNLYLKLKALTGESAVEFIRRIRFSYACKLLKEGKYNVSEVSTMIGFSPSYFATSFKKYMGCLPSEYIKKP